MSDEEELPPDPDDDPTLLAAVSFWQRQREENGLEPEQSLPVLLDALIGMIQGYQSIYKQGELDAEDRFKVIAISEMVAALALAKMTEQQRGMMQGPIVLGPFGPDEIPENPIEFLRKLFGEQEPSDEEKK